MDFEKEIPAKDFENEIPVEDFDTEFDAKELTPIKSLRSDPPPQYFTNIDGKYCKDVAGREELDELKALVDDVPWQPLEDGYSNFWFELTNDTLSPWLNFSAKTESAVIDWGDGSGEVALDTLTPTHTYSKAGRYVVKVKGVTGIIRQNNPPYSDYLCVLRNIELNSEVTTLSNYSFYYCVGLENAILNGVTAWGTHCFAFCANLKTSNIPLVTSILTQCFYNCATLHNIQIPEGVTRLYTYAFQGCIAMQSLSLPSTVTMIESYAFNYCNTLSEIHIKAVSPPSLGTNSLANLAENYIIYVPVGYGDTYKAASGWSTYADHILEEGQTPNRAMLAKFTKTEESEVMDDELYQDSNR